MPAAWEEELKVGIGMPLSHEGPPLNAKHLVQMQMPQPHGLIFDKRYGIDMARSAIVEDAIKHGGTHIIWLDEDIFPPLDGIMKLLRYHDEKAIVSGVYYDKKRGQKSPAVWNIHPESGEYCLIKDPEIYEETVNEEGGPHTTISYADAVGFGFCMTPVKLFEELEKPWFWYGLVRDEHKDEKEVKNLMSEDFLFCKRIKEELGYKVIVDWSIRCDHLTWAFISGRDGSMDIARI